MERFERKRKNDDKSKTKTFFFIQIPVVREKFRQNKNNPKVIYQHYFCHDDKIESHKSLTEVYVEECFWKFFALPPFISNCFILSVSNGYKISRLQKIINQT